MIGLAVDDHSPRKIGRTAVGFPVEVISPSADALAEGDGGNKKVQQIQRPHFPDQAQDACRAQPGDQSAVDRQPAAAEVQDLDDVPGVAAPVEQHVVGSRADDPNGNADEDHVQERILADPVFRRTKISDQRCDHNAAGNKNGIPHDLKAEYFKRDRVWRGHVSSLLSAPLDSASPIILTSCPAGKQYRRARRGVVEGVAYHR